MELFRALGLSENTLAALEKKGFVTPSPIQERTIPTLLQTDKDVVGQAQTGTGKTAAFGLPLIERIDENEKTVQAIVLCPTRELAIQVSEEILSFRGSKRINVLPIYGGQSYEIQIRGLRRGVHIVVGTPGRVRDHIDKGTLKLNEVKFMVLDEADEMLNMGFEEEVREILKEIPAERRMLLFSATMPPNILRLVKTFIKPGYELVEVQKEQVTTNTVDQIYYEVRDSDRFEALCRIIDTNPDFYGIVFCKTKMDTDVLSNKLNDRGYETEGIHGDVTQSQRELILRSFKAKKLKILVATDVAARGIDVNDLTHVVNYALPQDPEAYVHRIGRTGRAGKKGIAISLVSPGERRDFIFIQKVANTQIPKMILPTVSDIVAVKKASFKKQIQVLLAMGANEEYHDLADELIAESESAQILVAALLKYAVKDELSEDNYAEVMDMSSDRNAKSGGTIRLFVAKGKDDNYTPPKIVQFLEQEGGINGKAVTEVRMFDKFTFVNVNHDEAEQLLVVFGKAKGGRKPLVTRAKERDGSSDRSSRFDRNDNRSSDRPSRSGGFNRSERPAPRGEGFNRSERPAPRSEGGFGGNRDRKERSGDSSSFAKRERKPVSQFSNSNESKDSGGFKKRESAPRSTNTKTTSEITPKWDNDLSW
jgi:ATP-dependent RNA helicase DeaD